MFPGVDKTTLQTAWLGVTSTAGRIKIQAQTMAGATALTRKTILDYANLLADGLTALDSYSAVPGLLAYARNELNDTTLDLTIEFTTMRAQIVAVQDWLVANFPKDGTGKLIVYTFDGSKRFADVNLTAGELAAFKTQLNNLIGTIN